MYQAKRKHQEPFRVRQKQIPRQLSCAATRPPFLKTLGRAQKPTTSTSAIAGQVPFASLNHLCRKHRNGRDRMVARVIWSECTGLLVDSIPRFGSSRVNGWKSQRLSQETAVRWGDSSCPFSRLHNVTSTLASKGSVDSINATSHLCAWKRILMTTFMGRDGDVPNTSRPRPGSFDSHRQIWFI